MSTVFCDKRHEADPHSLSTNAVDDDHRRLRNRFSRALSVRAITSQEPVLRKYSDLFISGIRREVRQDPHAPTNMGKWFSLATFDVISELAFGESFDGLKNGEYHPWVSAVFGAFKALPFLRVVREIPGTIWLGNHAVRFLPERLKQMWYEHFDYAFGLMDHRFQNPKEKEDFIYYIFEGGDNDLTRDEIKESAAQLVMAGSEPLRKPCQLPLHSQLTLFAPCRQQPSSQACFTTSASTPPF